MTNSIRPEDVKVQHMTPETHPENYYGGKEGQDWFTTAREQLISRMVPLFQCEPKTTDTVTAVLNMLAMGRQVVAKNSKTRNADLFGKKRDIFPTETPLVGQYAKHNPALEKVLAKASEAAKPIQTINRLGLREKISVKVLPPGCFKKAEEIVGNMQPSETIDSTKAAAMKFMRRVNPQKAVEFQRATKAMLGTDPRDHEKCKQARESVRTIIQDVLDELPKDLSKTKEYEKAKQLMPALDPGAHTKMLADHLEQLYKKGGKDRQNYLKAVEAMSLLNHRNALTGYIPVRREYFFAQECKGEGRLIVTKRFEIQQKLYALGRYILSTCPHCHTSKAENHRYVVIWHQDYHSIPATMQKVKELVVEVLKMHSDNKAEIVKKIALITYLIIHAMPYERGSGAVAKWLEQILYKYHGIEITYKSDRNHSIEPYLYLGFDEYFSEYWKNILKLPEEIASKISLKDDEKSSPPKEKN